MLNLPFSPRLQSTLRTIDAIGQWGMFNLGLPYASATFPTAKKVFYHPVRVPGPIQITQLYCENGAAVSGNVDIGIYTLDGTRLVNSGSTAQTGTTAVQLFTVASTWLSAGVYYVAISLDNTTGTLRRFAPPSVGLAEAAGMLTQTTGTFGLPATATFAAVVDAFVASCGILVAGTM